MLLYKRAISLLGEGVLPPLEKLKRELRVEQMESGIEISPALAKVGEKFTDEIEALEIALEKSICRMIAVSGLQRWWRSQMPRCFSMR